jgi:hypothetical protein
MSVKLVPTFVDRGCRVVSTMDPHGRCSRFSRPGHQKHLSVIMCGSMSMRENCVVATQSSSQALPRCLHRDSVVATIRGESCNHCRLNSLTGWKDLVPIRVIVNLTDYMRGRSCCMHTHASGNIQ